MLATILNYDVKETIWNNHNTTLTHYEKNSFDGNSSSHDIARICRELHPSVS